MNIKKLTRAYDEVYLEDAMQNFAVMLDFGSAVCRGGLDEYYDRFLVSTVSKHFAAGNPRYIAGMSGVELAGSVIRATGGEAPVRDYVLADRSDVFWTGWSLAYLQWFTGYSFERIQSGLDVGTICSKYPVYHESDISDFLDFALHALDSGDDDVASRLKSLRQLSGYTQKELAERSGVSLRMIQAYEQGSQPLGRAEADAVFRLARSLGCEMEALL